MPTSPIDIGKPSQAFPVTPPDVRIAYPAHAFPRSRYRLANPGLIEFSSVPAKQLPVQVRTEEPFPGPSLE